MRSANTILLWSPRASSSRATFMAVRVSRSEPCSCPWTITESARRSGGCRAHHVGWPCNALLLVLVELDLEDECLANTAVAASCDERCIRDPLRGGEPYRLGTWQELEVIAHVDPRARTCQLDEEPGMLGEEHHHALVLAGWHRARAPENARIPPSATDGSCCVRVAMISMVMT